jgi:hypothetical protein
LSAEAATLQAEVLIRQAASSLISAAVSDRKQQNSLQLLQRYQNTKLWQFHEFYGLSLVTALHWSVF